MSEFESFEATLKQANASPVAIKAFERAFGVYSRGESSLMAEDSIKPVDSLFALSSAKVDFDPALLAKTAILKLNGGLGTSMGLEKAKSLLSVLEDKTFLDIIIGQVLHLRKSSGANVQFFLMNSFSTSDDTLSFLENYRDALGDPKSCELMQNQVPKIDATTKQPVTWPADPEHEWCPPGHGDLYVALVGSGMLDDLLEKGIEYLFVSNSDNLGATLDAALLEYFAQSSAPFLMEVTRRTEADKKGGHLARRVGDGQLVLREVAQCPDEDLAKFQDIDTHKYFNTNNLWIKLSQLKDLLVAHAGVLPLPIIVNKKTVDPRDAKSTPVIQLECAMGAAIECFQGAAAIDVPRSRFAPVKTTADLFALRSDAYELTEDDHLQLRAERKGIPPVITLSSEYKLVDSLDGMEIPSLLETESLSITGKVCFEKGVVFVGNVVLANNEEQHFKLKAGRYENLLISGH